MPDAPPTSRPSNVPPISYSNFEEAGQAVLSFLQTRLPFHLWMLTRTEQDDWIVLQAADRLYGIGQGDVFRWSDTICARMVRGEGPSAAPRIDDVPAYRSAPIARQIPIGAYMGVPLVRDDGSLFGTLCAVDPEEQSSNIADDLRLVELLGCLLSTVLNHELRITETDRRAEQAEAEALSDPLTGLSNRRAWERFLINEESRCRRYGHPACVFSVDLDHLKETNDKQGHAAGDALIQTAGRVIRETVRREDVVARLGGDEFAVLSVECNVDAGNVLLQRLHSRLDGNQISASIGMASRAAAGSLDAAYEAADEDMYRKKRAQRRP